MRKIIFILLFSIFVIGCVQEKAELKTTEDVEKQIQTPPPEQPLTKTEIKVIQKGMEMIISPSQDKVVKDIVTITVPKVPTNSALVAFGIIGPGIEPLEKTGPNLGYDADGSDGWSFEFDTNSYPNSEYTLAAIAFPANRQSGAPPLGAAQVTIVIENLAEDDLIPPTVTFPKIVSVWPTEISNEKIAEVKNMGANVVGLTVQAEYQNNNLMLSKNSDIYLKRNVREAYRNGLAVYLAVLLPSEMHKNLPYQEGSDTDLPQGYDLASVRNQLKSLYGEVALLAEQNKVHSIVIKAEIEPLLERVYSDAEEYWTQSSKINQEVVREIRKQYQGEIVGEVMGGMWGFDGPCCYTNVPVDKIDFTVFDALLMTTSSDYRITGSPLGYVEEGVKRVEFTRKIANKNHVKKLYVDVGGYPLISPWRGDRVTLYSEFFEKSSGKTDGYSISLIPEEGLPGYGVVYDNKAIWAAKNWYKKI